MRGTSEGELEKLVPIFARGLPILLVDHDNSSRTSISSMLQRYSFNVTTARSTTTAMSLIQEQDSEQESCFKLVMASLSLAKRENLSFLRALVKKGLPVILISSDKDANDAEKALAEGARLFLEQPIALSDLKYVWQHACQRRTDDWTREDSSVGMRRKRNPSEVPPPINSNNPNCNDKARTDPNEKNKQISMVPGPLIDGSLEGKKAEASSSHKVMKRPNNDENDREPNPNKKMNIGAGRVDSGKQKMIEEAKEMDKNGGIASEKKSRRVWTSELHLKFTAALSTLGDLCARPKSILQMMNVPHLTQRQVASHLQKYKTQVQRIGLVGTAGSVSSMPQIADPFAMDGALGREIFGFETGPANPTRFLPPSDPFWYQEFNNFLYQDLQRMNDFVRPLEASVSAPSGGGSNSDSRDSIDKPGIPGAEGTRIHQWPEMDLTNTSSPLEVDGDMEDYFSDLASILSIDHLSNEFNTGSGGPQLGLAEMEKEKISSLSAVNSTRNVSDYLPRAAPASSLLQHPLIETDPGMETSEGHFMNPNSLTDSSDFPAAFEDENPAKNTAVYYELLKQFEEEPDEFADLESKLNLDDVNRYSEWLEELLQEPSEAECNFLPLHSSKV